MAESFYYGNEMQDLLLACMLQMRSEFHVLAPLVKPEFMWGMDAMRVAAAMQDYHEEQGIYPGVVAVDNYLHEKYSRDKADIYVEAHDYIEKLKKIDTKDWKWVKKVTIKFCKERALICAIKESADLVKTGKITPDIIKMFEQAMKVGQELSDDDQGSIMDYYDREIDESAILLGDGFASRGEISLFVGPSGVGKSSASLQLIGSFAAGKAAFGITPGKEASGVARALKILVIQGENDANAMIRMSKGVINGLKFTEDEKKLIRDNTWFVRHNQTNGPDFLGKIVAPYLAEMRPDILWLDPLMCYLGGDPSDVECVSAFLRNHLTTLLQRYNCGGVIVHHTSKLTNRDTSKWRPIEYAYAACGSAELTNVPRGILVLDPTQDDHVFKFIAAKAGRGLHWEGKDGASIVIRYFSHSRKPDQIVWEDASSEDIQRVDAKQKDLRDKKEKYPDRELLVPLLKKGTVLSFEELFNQVQATGCPIARSTFWERRARWIKEELLVEVSKGNFELNIEAFSRLNGLSDLPVGH